MKTNTNIQSSCAAIQNPVHLDLNQQSSTCICDAIGAVVVVEVEGVALAANILTLASFESMAISLGVRSISLLGGRIHRQTSRISPNFSLINSNFSLRI